MTITQIKQEILNSTEPIGFNQSVNDQTKEKFPWAIHWDNSQRKRIVIHLDTYGKLTNDHSISNLSYKSEVKTSKSSGLEYTQYLIFQYTEPDLGSI